MGIIFTTNIVRYIIFQLGWRIFSLWPLPSFVTSGDDDSENASSELSSIVAASTLEVS